MKLPQRSLLRRFFPIAIFIVGILQYANTINHDYAWDDKLVITANPYTIKGIAGLNDIFTERVSVPNKNVYRPIPQAMFAIEYDLFNGNPHVSHLINVILYALLCTLIYYFVAFVLGSYGSSFAFFVAFLYAVHPLHVEVVANIKSRDEILAFAFGLLAIIAIVQFIEHLKWKALVLGAISFVIAVLSKENVVTLLPIILLVVWYRRPAFPVKKIVVSFVILTIVAAGILYWTNHHINSSSENTAVQLNATVLNNEFLWTKNSNQIYPTSIVNIGRYLLLFVYPHPLIHLYGYHQIPFSSWFSPATLCMIAILLYALYYIIHNFKRKTAATFGIVFFFTTYSVYSNFFVLAPDTMADRYMFIPSLGLALILADVLFSVSNRFPYFKRLRSVLPLGSRIACAIVLTVFFVKTYTTNSDWENDFTLTYNRMPYMQENAAAQATYGLMLHRESLATTEEALKGQKRAEAMNAFLKSISIYPDFYWSWISIGKIFAESGMYDKAELAFLKAQQLEPVSPDSYFCLGSLYFTLKDDEAAISYLERSVLIDPEIEQSFVMLGKAYLQADKLDNLSALSASCLQRFPNNAEFDALMASFHFRNGRFADARRFVQRTLNKDPRNLTGQLLLETLKNSPGTN